MSELLPIPLVGWNNFIRTQILIPSQKDKIYTKAVLLGAIINILINIVLIQLFSARGAAIATVISYFVITVYQTIHAKEQLDMKRVYHFIPILLIVGGIMYGSVRLVSLININYIVKLLVEVIVGGVVYGSLMIIYFYKKDKEFLELIKN